MATALVEPLQSLWWAPCSHLPLIEQNHTVTPAPASAAPLEVPTIYSIGHLWVASWRFFCSQVHRPPVFSLLFTYGHKHKSRIFNDFCPSYCNLEAILSPSFTINVAYGVLVLSSHCSVVLCGDFGEDPKLLKYYAATIFPKSLWLITFKFYLHTASFT